MPDSGEDSDEDESEAQGEDPFAAAPAQPPQVRSPIAALRFLGRRAHRRTRRREMIIFRFRCAAFLLVFGISSPHTALQHHQ